jgi:hypothetical protein
MATVSTTINCTGSEITGSAIENPSGGAAGALNGGHPVLVGCTVNPYGQHCSVRAGGPNGTILLAEVQASARSGHSLTFAPYPGSLIGTFELNGCATAMLDGVYGITGTFTGVEAAPGTGTFIFNSTTGSELKMGGIRATLSSTLRLKSAGAAVTLKE